MAKTARITKKYINKRSQAGFLLEHMTTQHMIPKYITEHFNSHHPDELKGKLAKKFKKAKKHWECYINQLEKDYAKAN